MSGLLENLGRDVSWLDVADILLVSFLFYKLLQLIRGSRAVHMVVGTFVIVVVFFVSRWTELNTLNWLLRNTLAYLGFAVVVLYQAELRKALASLGRAPLFRFLNPSSSKETIDEIVFASLSLARSRTGAIIVVERDIGLRGYIEGGIAMDAFMTYDLLLSIFNTKSPLHDGAAIVQGDRIAAAACFLPLTINPQLSRELGTRHRAALGITEDTDAVAIVVSEEQGTVSFIEDGNLEVVAGEELRAKLREAMDRSDAKEREREREAARPKTEKAAEAEVTDTSKTETTGETPAG